MNHRSFSKSAKSRKPSNSKAETGMRAAAHVRMLIQALSEMKEHRDRNKAMLKDGQKNRCDVRKQAALLLTPSAPTAPWLHNYGRNDSNKKSFTFPVFCNGKSRDKTE
ncbi:hypothetical protein TRVL_08770 [Trypanosoma vivax]|nr:hypothetical protein TRVL_08770 [Trypanosoma vivax]